jgi:hypothetical protein
MLIPSIQRERERERERERKKAEEEEEEGGGGGERERERERKQWGKENQAQRLYVGFLNYSFKYQNHHSKPFSRNESVSVKRKLIAGGDENVEFMGTQPAVYLFLYTSLKQQTCLSFSRLFRTAEGSSQCPGLLNAWLVPSLKAL